jgi:hypothetical protein|eukprot:COSAG01_NODE_2108_length_8408_cov_138.235768_6_plen_104_part_00
MLAAPPGICTDAQGAGKGGESTPCVIYSHNNIILYPLYCTTTVSLVYCRRPSAVLDLSGCLAAILIFFWRRIHDVYVFWLSLSISEAAEFRISSRFLIDAILL